MIDVKRENGAWTVTLSRPEKANSLTRDMLTRLADIAAGAVESQARVLVLTGAGKVFSAGADLGEARAGLAQDGIWEEVSAAIAALPCLTIAALNGSVAAYSLSTSACIPMSGTQVPISESTPIIAATSGCITKLIQSYAA